MKRSTLLILVGIASMSASVATAQAKKETKPAAQPATQPEMALPPGMTEADMMACAQAAQPGEMHAFLAESVGTWSGKTTMWMTPEAEPLHSECTTVITPMMDGRFVRCETTGDMPGMGPFNGFGLYGFDNVSENFQGTWIDNCGTGMMTGTGELSSDAATLTWKFDYNCPITRKSTVFREVERRTGKDTMTLEMYSVFPHTGKEFKMMEILYTRVSTETSADAQSIR